MTPEAVEALALHRAAARVLEFKEAGEMDLARLGPSSRVEASVSAAAHLADAILALAPMTPLQAALQVPEVRAMREALEEIASLRELQTLVREWQEAASAEAEAISRNFRVPHGYDYTERHRREKAEHRLNAWGKE